jgi:hypothetical protein
MTQIVTASGETGVPGVARLSTSGRYAIVFLGSTARIDSAVSISLLDLQSGAQTPIKLAAVGDSVVGHVRLQPLGQRHSQTRHSELGKIRTTFARAAHQFVIDGDSRDAVDAELVNSLSYLRRRHIQHPDFARRASSGFDRRD